LKDFSFYDIICIVWEEYSYQSRIISPDKILRFIHYGQKGKYYAINISGNPLTNAGDVFMYDNRIYSEKAKAYTGKFRLSNIKI